MSKTKLEYIWLDGYKPTANLRSKTKIVEKFGGKFLVRGGEFQTVEGNWEHTRNILIQFPSYERALEWYNSHELKPVKQKRLDNSTSNSIIIKGV